MCQVHPALTVIVPARNAGKYLDRAIRSVLAQTFAGWEMIVVDDCSTDDTFAIASRHAAADPRIRVIRLPEPSGCPYMARYEAAIRATAPLVAPLDADDTVESTYLEALLALRRSSGADVVYPTMLFHEGHRVVRRLPRFDDAPHLLFSGPEAMKMTLDDWKIGCNGGLIDRFLYLDTYRRMGTGPELIYSCSDELHTRLLLLAAHKVAVSTTPYHYNDTPGSVTRTPGSSMFDFMRNNPPILRMIGELLPDDIEAIRLAQAQNFAGVIYALRLLNRHRFDRRGRRTARALIRRSMSLMDHTVLRRAVSRKYYLLLRTGLIPARLILRLYDSIHRPAHE